MDTTEVKSELLKLKAEVLGRVEALGKDKMRSKGAISNDFSEQYLDTMNDQVVDGLEDTEREELRLINVALSHIENGTYGECVECSETIGVGRLKAMPYAVNCINCAKE